MFGFSFSFEKIAFRNAHARGKRRLGASVATVGSSGLDVRGNRSAKLKLEFLATLSKQKKSLGKLDFPQTVLALWGSGGA